MTTPASAAATGQRVVAVGGRCFVVCEIILHGAVANLQAWTMWGACIHQRVACGRTRPRPVLRLLQLSRILLWLLHGLVDMPCAVVRRAAGGGVVRLYAAAGRSSPSHLHPGEELAAVFLWRVLLYSGILDYSISAVVQARRRVLQLVPDCGEGSLCFSGEARDNTRPSHPDHRPSKTCASPGFAPLKDHIEFGWFHPM